MKCYNVRNFKCAFKESFYFIINAKEPSKPPVFEVTPISSYPQFKKKKSNLEVYAHYTTHLALSLHIDL